VVIQNHITHFVLTNDNILNSYDLLLLILMHFTKVTVAVRVIVMAVATATFSDFLICHSTFYRHLCRKSLRWQGKLCSEVSSGVHNTVNNFSSTSSGRSTYHTDVNNTSVNVEQLSGGRVPQQQKMLSLPTAMMMLMMIMTAMMSWAVNIVVSSSSMIGGELSVLTFTIIITAGSGVGGCRVWARDAWQIIVISCTSHQIRA